MKALLKLQLAAFAVLLLIGCGTTDNPGTGEDGADDPGASNTQNTIIDAVLADCSGAYDVSPTVADAGFTFVADKAIMRGYITSGTPALVDALIKDHPEVTTILMAKVPGSDDDNANIQAARKVRAAALTTCVPDGGEISSGGVDFFLAGVKRKLGAGTFVGVHSWSSGGGQEGSAFPQGDLIHNLFLNYYTEMGIDTDFYWYTLAAAPSWGIHDMTPAERSLYGIATEM